MIYKGGNKIMMIGPTRYIAAIRKFEEKEWLDILTISSSLSVSQHYSDEVSKNCGPQWTKANPVIRIATIEIREIRKNKHPKIIRVQKMAIES